MFFFFLLSSSGYGRGRAFYSDTRAVVTSKPEKKTLACLRMSVSRLFGSLSAARRSGFFRLLQRYFIIFWNAWSFSAHTANQKLVDIYLLICPFPRVRFYSACFLFLLLALIIIIILIPVRRCNFARCRWKTDADLTQLPVSQVWLFCRSVEWNWRVHAHCFHSGRFEDVWRAWDSFCPAGRRLPDPRYVCSSAHFYYSNLAFSGRGLHGMSSSASHRDSIGFRFLPIYVTLCCSMRIVWNAHVYGYVSHGVPLQFSQNRSKRKKMKSLF